MRKLLLESALKARIYKFDYAKFKTDPNPSVLYLGRWNQPDTKNTLIGGINLNYLNREETQELSQKLGDIMPGNSLKSRSRRLENTLPEIFEKSYRTYEISAISGLKKSTFEFSGEPAPAIPADPEQAQIRTKPEDEPLAPTRIEPEEVTKAEIPSDDMIDGDFDSMEEPIDMEKPTDMGSGEPAPMDQENISELEKELDDALNLGDDENIDDTPDVDMGIEDDQDLNLGIEEPEEADLTSRQRRSLNQKDQTIINPNAGVMKARSDENR